MKKNEVEVGGVYHARISGKFVHVRIDRIDSIDPMTLRGRSRTMYYATNLMTNRKITFQSATKLRGKVIPRTTPMESAHVQ